VASLAPDFKQVVARNTAIAIRPEFAYTVYDSQIPHRSICLLCPHFGTPPSPHVTLAKREILALKGASHEYLCRQSRL
jgi:hypothetical protein